MRMPQISIIGSGFGWLSAACYLAKAWYTVHVYEKNEQLGWRASVKTAKGYTRDMWPSRYLMPDLFEKFFDDMWKDIHNYLDLTHLDPSYRIFFKDDSETPYIDIHQDMEKNRAALEALEPWSTDQLITYIAKSGEQYHVAMDHFVWKNYDSVRDLFTREGLIHWVKINIFESIGSYVKKRFNNEKIQKIIQYPMIFLGSPPARTPALYNLMTYVDFGMGVWYPQGGIGAVVQALVDIGKELWVTYHTHSEITQIHTTPTDTRRWPRSKTTGLSLADGTYIASDYIISNADMHHTETQLIKNTALHTYPDNFWTNHTLAPSGFIIYLWLDTKLKHVKHHTLVFAPDREQHHTEIFDEGVFPTDPSLYICCPSQTDPSTAPAWWENLFVLVPFPSRVSMSPEQMEAYSKMVLHTCEKVLWEDITGHIVHKEYFGPDEFTSRYHAYWWNALAGWAHIFSQSSILRPKNRSKHIQNLYYAWWYVNPGIWMPTCIISGKLAAERIIGK